LLISRDSQIPPNNVDISVIIPVYNLEKQIVVQLESLSAILKSSLNYEIIIVNDGSTDRTLEVLRKVEETDNHVRVISYPQNEGKGYAVKRGVIESVGRLAIMLDGDRDISFRLLVDFLTETKNYDLVIGSKRHPLSNIDLPLSRTFYNRVFNILVRATTGIKIKDTQVGLKVGKGDIFRAIFKYINTKRYAFDVELLTIASILKLNIKEMPVDIKHTHHLRLWEIVYMLLDFIAVSCKYKISHSYQKQILSELRNPDLQETTVLEKINNSQNKSTINNIFWLSLLILSYYIFC
jgi:dolichol-phosphate mannosyltransferase